MTRKTNVTAAVLAVVGLSAGYGVWQANRLPAAADSAAVAADPQVSSDDYRHPHHPHHPHQEIPAARIPPTSNRDLPDPSDDRRDPLRGEFPVLSPGDETPDDRASIEALLDHPDADVRSEATALLALFDEEAWSDQ